VGRLVTIKQKLDFGPDLDLDPPAWHSRSV
jgi:hypothetical protein